MSDKKLELEASRIIIQSGYSKSEELLSPLTKILQMRHREIPRNQALRVVKAVLK